MQDKKCTKWCKISSHKRQNYQSTVGYSERSSTLTASEKHPSSIQSLWLQCQDSLCTLHSFKKNFMDNPPTHDEKEKHTSPCLFSHNKGMNTMICVLQPPFPPLLSSTRPQVYSKVRLPRWRCLIWTRYLMYRAHAWVRSSPNWRQDSGWPTCCIVGCIHAYV